MHIPPKARSRFISPKIHSEVNTQRVGGNRANHRIRETSGVRIPAFTRPNTPFWDTKETSLACP